MSDFEPELDFEALDQELEVEALVRLGIDRLRIGESIGSIISSTSSMQELIEIAEASISRMRAIKETSLEIFDILDEEIEKIARRNNYSEGE